MKSLGFLRCIHLYISPIPAFLITLQHSELFTRESEKPVAARDASVQSKAAPASQAAPAQTFVFSEPAFKLSDAPPPMGELPTATGDLGKKRGSIKPPPEPPVIEWGKKTSLTPAEEEEADLLRQREDELRQQREKAQREVEQKERARKQVEEERARQKAEEEAAKAAEIARNKYKGATIDCRHAFNAHSQQENTAPSRTRYLPITPSPDDALNTLILAPCVRFDLSAS